MAAASARPQTRRQAINAARARPQGDPVEVDYGPGERENIELVSDAKAGATIGSVSCRACGDELSYRSIPLHFSKQHAALALTTSDWLSVKDGRFMERSDYEVHQLLWHNKMVKGATPSSQSGSFPLTAAPPPAPAA